MRLQIRADVTEQKVVLSTQAWSRTLTPTEANRWSATLAQKAGEADEGTLVRLTDDGETLAIRTPEQAIDVAQKTSLAAHTVVSGDSEALR